MAEYVEKNEIREEILNWAVCLTDTNMLSRSDALFIIDNVEAADVAPVVHGRWEWITQDKYRCNICGRITRVDECMGKPMYSGCPYCRAQMNLGQEEKTNEK